MLLLLLLQGPRVWVCSNCDCSGAGLSDGAAIAIARAVSLFFSVSGTAVTAGSAPVLSCADGIAMMPTALTVEVIGCVAS